MLVPVMLYFIIEGQDMAALMIFAIAAISDGLDGFMAKILKQQTRLGAFLDPIADKLLLATKTGADADDKGNIDFSVIIPEGKYKVWVRLWFDKGSSVDSNDIEQETFRTKSSGR